jgi:hypothetical protein
VIIEGRVQDRVFIDRGDTSQFALHLLSNTHSYRTQLRGGPAVAAAHLIETGDCIKLEGTVTIDEPYCETRGTVTLLAYDVDLARLHVKIRNDEWQPLDIR